MSFHENNIRIFEESRKLWETDPALQESVENSRARPRLVGERKHIPCHEGEKRFRDPVRVKVSHKRSFQAAAAYRSRRVCVLNFASATNPGGGVKAGSSAQEECLCRCSTLYPCLDTEALMDGFYQPHRDEPDPLHNDDCIYTPSVTVFRYDDEDAALLPTDGRYRVDVLTCAAPDLRDTECPAGKLRRLLEKRIRRIFDLAAEQGAEVLILGAFGCGVFANDPRQVAAAFRTVLEDYEYCFETVEFAVPGDGANHRAFFGALAGFN